MTRQQVSLHDTIVSQGQVTTIDVFAVFAAQACGGHHAGGDMSSSMRFITRKLEFSGG
jgi:hypothetical protein